MNKTIIFGTGDIAQLALFYLSIDSDVTPVAFCVDRQHLKDEYVNGLPVVPFEDIKKTHPPHTHTFFAPLYNNSLRAKKTDEIRDKGYQLISYCSSKATIWGEVGNNCFIMENNVIQPFTTIGDNTICWSGNHIGHHSKIGNNVFISSHVVIAGHCEIKDFAWLGINAAIRDHVCVAERCTIGMGSVVVKNTLPDRIYMGNPAKCGKD